MVAVLASPRFVFRVEETEPERRSEPGHSSLLDEYALASRLSYFLWSTMPDDELFGLAERHELRRTSQPRSHECAWIRVRWALTRNFVGQWLRGARCRGNRHQYPGRAPPGRKPAAIDLDGSLRRAMSSETEMAFAHVVREDRSILELIDSDYTFVEREAGEALGIKGVTGSEMRKVALPKDSPRGGVLTQASILLVTSNPDRTSPVKRGSVHPG